MLFAQRAREEFKVREVYVALRDGHESVTPPMLESAGMRLLFDKPRELERWYVRLERGLARVASWELRGEAPGEAEAGEAAPGEEEAAETAAEVVNRDAAAAAAGDAAVVPGAAAADSSPLDFGAALLPLTWCRDGQVRPYTAGVVLRPGDRLALAFYTDHATDGERWLRARGWEAVDAAVGLPAAAVAGGIR